MKILVKLLSLSLLLTFTNCSNDDSNDLQTNQQSEFTKIINLNSNSQQKIAFKMLSSKEKYDIWNLKYDIIKENDFVFFNNKRLNFNQITILKELFESLEVEYFETKNSKKSRLYYDSYLPKMKKKALEHFSMNELNYVFSSLNIVGKVAQLPEIDCGCNPGDDWCSSGGCIMPCTESSTWGCGWWLAEPCNGACGSIDIN